MKPCVCYFGDDELSGPAAYLAGAMRHCGFEFVHISSRTRASDELFEEPYALYVLSDYPSAGFSIDQLKRLVTCIEYGSGLLMIGGWESFFGRTGEYANRPLEKILPVYLWTADDRVNSPQGTVVRLNKRHPITDYLPWDRPPVIAGFNRVVAKDDALTLLVGDCLKITDSGTQVTYEVKDTVPLLVVGKHGLGRTAALACDVAPHWVGGWVDWGERRVVRQIPSGGFIEVGDAYVRFIGQLIGWTSRLWDLPDAYPEEPAEPVTNEVPLDSTVEIEKAASDA